jgi:hypothetical protein
MRDQRLCTATERNVGILVVSSTALTVPFPFMSLVVKSDG